MESGLAGLGQPGLRGVVGVAGVGAARRLIVLTSVKSSALITVTVSAPEFVTQSRLFFASKKAKLGEAPTGTGFGSAVAKAPVVVSITETLSPPWFTAKTFLLSLLI